MELEILSRRLKPPRTEVPCLDAPPSASAGEQQSFLLTVAPSFTMALPMLLGFYLLSRNSAGSGAGYMSMGLCTVIGSAVLGAFWAGANCRRRSKKMRFASRLRKRTYRNYLKQAEAGITEAVRYQTNYLRNRDPDFPEWIDKERELVRCVREEAKDTVRIRIGTGSTKFPLRLSDGLQRLMQSAPAGTAGAGRADPLITEALEVIRTKAVLKNVPICVELRAGETLTCHAEKPSDLCNLLVVLVIRCALTFSECSVRMLFLLEDPLLIRQITWTNFLPHTVPPDERDPLRGMGEDAQLLIFTQRGGMIGEEMRRTGKVIEIRLSVRGESGTGGETAAAVSNAKAVSVYLTEQFGGLVGEDGGRCAVRFDRLSYREAELAARALCRLKDPETQSGGLPGVYPILKMLPVAENNLAAGWDETDVLTSLRVPLGVDAAGRIVTLDAHDGADGPHGLIAGMTGSGKSELLMTFILSLAVKYPPWEVAFFLIDYKGGGMSSAFATLPHVIGSISNLSGATIERAFKSIRAENERRQQLFLETGVNHISGYHRKYRAHLTDRALPHLFLIIDEFAQLKTEEPEFMQELIGLSRVGRSLGIHLLLCTQKPSGSVDTTIMTNARFQIALRLQDPLDSREIIRHPDAADLKNPGEAILRVGNDEIYTRFQCAYALSPAKDPKERIVIRTDAYGRELPDPEETGEREGAGAAKITGMDVLLEKIAEAVILTQTVKKRPEVDKLWLEELPEVIGRKEMARYGVMEGDSAADDFAVPVGVYDDPENVCQGIVTFDHRAGHRLICGMPRSGKSTLMKTYAAGVIDRTGHPDLYVIDYGGGTLYATVAGKMKAGVHEGEEEKALSMLRMLSDERRPGILLIDGYGAMLQDLGYQAGGLVNELLRVSPLQDLTLMVSACGLGVKEVNQSMQAYMQESICLRLQDPYLYAEALREAHFKGQTDLCPGRGYVKMGDHIVLFQGLMPEETGR